MRFNHAAPLRASTLREAAGRPPPPASAVFAPVPRPPASGLPKPFGGRTIIPSPARLRRSARAGCVSPTAARRATPGGARRPSPSRQHRTAPSRQHRPSPSRQRRSPKLRPLFHSVWVAARGVGGRLVFPRESTRVPRVPAPPPAPLPNKRPARTRPHGMKQWLRPAAREVRDRAGSDHAGKGLIKSRRPCASAVGATGPSWGGK